MSEAEMEALDAADAERPEGIEESEESEVESESDSESVRDALWPYASSSNNFIQKAEHV